MGIQLIFVVEADEKSRSDYIYIKSVLDSEYNIRLNNDIKLSPVFMKGKGNYNQRRIKSKIDALCKQYGRIGDSKIFFCFDTDQFDIKPEDKKSLAEKESFCRKNNYEFVWFCHDIEEVFLGQSVADSEKTKCANKFAARTGIKGVKMSNLRSKTMVGKKSNLVLELDKVLVKKKKGD